MSTTTIYVPTPITSAEQAEALPEGSRVLEDRDGLPRAWVKSGDVFLGHGLVLLVPREVVGMQSLVPMEAEVVHSEPKGVGFATERLAGGPFTAYYVHERTA